MSAVCIVMKMLATIAVYGLLLLLLVTLFMLPGILLVNVLGL